MLSGFTSNIGELILNLETVKKPFEIDSRRLDTCEVSVSYEKIESISIELTRYYARINIEPFVLFEEGLHLIQQPTKLTSNLSFTNNSARKHFVSNFYTQVFRNFFKDVGKWAVSNVVK